jgi:hypothetical protein
VVPEDVQAVLPAVAGHRLQSRHADDATRLREFIESVRVP